MDLRGVSVSTRLSCYSGESNLMMIRARVRAFVMVMAAIVVVAFSSIVSAGSVSDPNYREGFGQDATGGAGYPVYIVTSSAATGAGTFYQAFQPGDYVSNKTIVFAVPTVTLPSSMHIGSNVTIDGMANGMNGVTMNATADAKRNLVIEDPASNIIIRGINFRSTGTPNSGVTEFDLLTVDGTNGSSISNLFIDRCTFMQASDGALDITGNVSSVTVQRSLFYNNAITSLIKYGTRQNLSIHHNVFTHNGERNPQVKGDMRLLDFVNNVIDINAGDVTNYPDGTPTDPYGLRIWNANSTSDSPGNVTINVTANAHMGNRGLIDLITDSGASAAGVFIGSDNFCSPPSNCPASPRTTPNAVPTASAVTTLTVDQFASQMLPYVGAPNRTALDQQRLDEVAAALPVLSPPPAPTGLIVH
jgi:pectate lyase